MCSFLSFPSETSCWTRGSERQTENKELRDAETKPRDVRQSDRELQEGKSWNYRQGAGQVMFLSEMQQHREMQAEKLRERKREIKQLKREVKRGAEVDGDPGRETKTKRSKERDQNVVIEKSRWPSPVSRSQSLHPGLPRVCPSLLVTCFHSNSKGSTEFAYTFTSFLSA